MKNSKFKIQNTGSEGRRPALPPERGRFPSAAATRGVSGAGFRMSPGQRRRCEPGRLALRGECAEAANHSVIFQF